MPPTTPPTPPSGSPEPAPHRPPVLATAPRGRSAAGSRTSGGGVSGGGVSGGGVSGGGVSGTAGPPLGWLLAAAIAVAVLGQLWTWSRLEGYQIADSVEYLDRAAAVARGEALDPDTPRSFAFSAVLLPIAALHERLGLDARAALALARLMQMVLAAGAIIIVGRTAGRAFAEEPRARARAGPSTNVALRADAAARSEFVWIAGTAGLLLALQPIFLRWSITPLAASASLLFVSLAFSGLERARGGDRSTLSRGLRTGLAFGAAVLCAYQNLLILFACAPLLLLAPRWRRPGHVAGLAAGLGAMLLVQGLLDLLTYGRFASSLIGYLGANGVGAVVSLLAKAGFTDTAFSLYDMFYGAADRAAEAAAAAGGEALDTAQAEAPRQIRSKFPTDWYFDQLLVQGLAIAAVLSVALGLLRGLRRPGWFVTLVTWALVVNLVVMSVKGSKSFRLWMPLLPLLVWIGTYGLVPVARAAARLEADRTRALARAALALFVGLLMFGSQRLLRDQNFGQFGDYWEAMEYVAEATRDFEGETRPVVASAYDWGVRWQQPEWLELQKLPHHVDRWPNLSAAERDEVLLRFRTLDYYIAHHQTITQDAAIVDALNARFEIAAVFHDQEQAEEVGPVYVLAVRSGAPDARTFFDVHEDTGPGEPNEPGRYQSRLQHPISVDYRRRGPEGTQQMVLLGFDVEPGLCGDDQAWVTLHWYAGTPLLRDYTIVSRFTDGQGGAWQDNHATCYGVHPTTSWTPGSIISEGYLSRISWDSAGFGGPWRRGDRIPVEMWLAISSFDERGASTGGLNPFRSSAAGPISKLPLRSGGYWSKQGRRWSKDGLFLVGGFELDVPPARQLPDDGRPLKR